MEFRNSSVAYRIVVAAEGATRALFFLGALFLLVGLPSILSFIMPSPLLPLGVGWVKSFIHSEQAIFDRCFPPLDHMPIGVAGVLGGLLSWLMAGLTRILRRVRIPSQARRDGRPCMLVLRSFTDTALQESPRHLYPLAMAASLAFLPFPLAQFAIKRGEERELITTIDEVFGETARVLILKPRSLKSTFMLFSRLLELEVENEQWKQAFLLLAQSSQAVLLMPSATAGVLQEAAMLRSDGDLLARTVVVLPPVETQRFTWYTHHPAKSWTGVQEVWRAAGLHLPPYPDAGIAYLPNTDFSVNRAASLDRTIGNLARAVADLLPSLETSVSTAAAIANVDALTGRSEKRKLMLTAAAASLISVVILATSVTLVSVELRASKAAQLAQVYQAAERVIEGDRTATTRSRLNPQLGLVLALYAWDHVEAKPPVVVQALLKATQDSLVEAAPEWSTDSERVLAIVPQDTGQLMAESDSYLRRFTVTSSLKETFKVSRLKLCLSGRLAFGTSGSFAVACDLPKMFTASYSGGKPEILDGPERLGAIAIERERIVWADASHQIVVLDAGREVWRTRVAAPISEILLSPNGRFAWIQGEAAGVLLDLDRHARVFSREDHGSRGVGFSPSSDFLIEGSSLHDLSTGAIRRAGTDQPDTAEAVTSGGLLIAMGRSNGAVEIAIGNGTLRIAKLEEAVRSLRFLGGTGRLAGAAGNQVLVFDVDAALKLRRLLELLEAEATASEGGTSGSRMREIQQNLGLVRGRTRKLTASECETYLHTYACPDGL